MLRVELRPFLVQDPMRREGPISRIGDPQTGKPDEMVRTLV